MARVSKKFMAGFQGRWDHRSAGKRRLTVSDDGHCRAQGERGDASAMRPTQRQELGSGSEMLALRLTITDAVARAWSAMMFAVKAGRSNSLGGLVHEPTDLVDLRANKILAGVVLRMVLHGCKTHCEVDHFGCSFLV